ncbi:hypothetical protein DB346_18915 [Verrucomicrobia bacterium LW23]|nr:hypothetical protein DB346_18915 [Verrucomicrobia bacterium LW23]
MDVDRNLTASRFSRIRTGLTRLRPVVDFVAYSLVASVLCGVWAPLAVLANPSGESVVAGQGTFSRNGSTLTVTQGSDRMIVNWQEFSINPWETTRFIQPGVNAAALNRVTGGNASQIMGALQANGGIYLINPNGIVIGNGARIDTGSFLASTLDVSDAQFMAGGQMNFLGPSAATVQNLGVINASNGDVILIAQEVINQGEINAPNGTAALAAGNDVLLKPTGDVDGQKLTVRVSEAELGVRKRDKGVTNTGRINAATAELKAAGGNVYALAINNTGVIRANALQSRGGRIFLTSDGGKVANHGTLRARGGKVVMNSASQNRTRAAGSPGSSGSTLQAGVVDVSDDRAGRTGGTAHLLGNRVFVGKNAVVDARGNAGGGTILVGGDFQGANDSVVNADLAFVDAGAHLRADALQHGDGGKIIVWSDNQTVIQDAILSAKGGPGGGNGGLIETSGKKSLVFAPREITVKGGGPGSDGIILLDPENIYIEGTFSYDDYEVADGEVLFNDVGYYYYPPVDFYLTPGSLNVLTGNVVLQARNSIYINEALSFTSANRVIFQAGNSIFINASVTGNNTQLAFIANSAMPSAPPPVYSFFSTEFSLFAVEPNPVNNVIYIAPGVTVTSGGADISLNALTFDIQGNVNAGAGTVFVGRFPGDRSTMAMTVGDAGLTSDMLLRLSGSTLVLGSALMETTVQSGVYQYFTASSLASVAPIAPASPTLFKATGDITLGSVTASSFRAEAGGSIVQTAGTVLSGGAFSLQAGGSTLLGNVNVGTLEVTSAGSFAQWAGTQVQGTSVVLTSDGAITLGNLVAGSLSLNAGGAVAQTGDSVVSARTLQVAAGGPVALSNTGNVLDQLLNVAFGSTASFYSSGNMVVSGLVSGGGSFTAVSAGNLVLGAGAQFSIQGEGSSMPIVSLGALGNLTIENASVLLGLGGSALFHLYSSTEGGANLGGLSLLNGLDFVVYGNTRVPNPAFPPGNGVFFGNLPPAVGDAPDREPFDLLDALHDFMKAQTIVLQSDLPDVSLTDRVWIFLPDPDGNFVRYEVIVGRDDSYLISDAGIYKVSNQSLLEATRGALGQQVEQALRNLVSDPAGELRLP